MTTMQIFILLCGLAAVLYGLITSRQILSLSTGNEKMAEIANAIQEGARAYLNRQYMTIGIVGVVIFVLIWLVFGLASGVGFLIGAIFSGAAGYVGMNISVRSNVRTTQAASSSLAEGLSVSFKAGAVTGMLVAGFALLSIALYYFVLDNSGQFPGREIVAPLVSLGFGASLISIFARLGGGIFTKGADVGADLVGKVEAGIPEDDPRNPAVIADNVGDNVGDCAGMAADLFETYVVTVVATMVLSSIFFANVSEMMMYPLAIAGVCTLASIVGTYFVKLGKSQNIMAALYKGFAVSAILSAVLLYFITDHVISLDSVFTVGEKTFTGMSLFYCGIAGLVITGLIIWVTEYYTGTNYRPVQSIAKASTTGHGTNVIQGLAISLEATAMPAIIIVAGIIVTHSLAGLFGIAIAVTTMLALAGMVVALDAYGPVTDNAGGIAEMAELDDNVRKTTDALDSVFTVGEKTVTGMSLFYGGIAGLVISGLIIWVTE
jgi:K(+)-stimulated pyrophosphate-energized sodium pump